MKKKFLYIAFLSFVVSSFSQNKIDINVTLHSDTDQLIIKQFIAYKNTTETPLDTIYLNDWSNSFSTKKTPLAKRFAEQYSTAFHFAKNEDRGYTAITTLKNENGTELVFERLKNQPDVIKVVLAQPLQKGNVYQLYIDYTVQLPTSKFTDYGVTNNKDYKLKYWYITPAVYDGTWHYYSNKNLNDLYVAPADINLQLELPNNYVAISELDRVNSSQDTTSQTILFSGKNRIDSKLFISKINTYKTVKTDNFTVVSNLTERGLEDPDKALITDKVTQFIEHYLGEYPHEKLFISKVDVDNDPAYGLNQLPKFIRPFPKNFQYELTLLKNALGNYIDNTLIINPRKEQWLRDGIQIYFLMKYMDDHYPDMKLLGTLAKIWGIRSFHASDLTFNEQYNLMYMHMARTNRDQPLNMAKDSLIKFNQNLASRYKAGVGLNYLDDYINSNILETTIKSFLQENKQQLTSTKDFENYLKSKTSKDVNWFFDDYISTNKKIDFKIKKVTHTPDSITLTIKNKRDSNVPVSLFTISNDSVISKTWITNIKDKKKITIAKNNADRLVLNYDNTIPEFNLRDNWKSLKGFFFNSKPLQFRLFKDFEDPHYNQVFFMPLAQFKNIYDGLTLGAKVYNKTVLRKQFNYQFSPQFATKSKSLTGSGTISYTKNVENKSLYRIYYGIGVSYQSYAEDLFFRRISPGLAFTFRDKDDYRSNTRHFLNFRYLDINRDEDINNISEVDDPDYAVFNARYTYSDDNLINFKKWSTDLQFSKNFGKLALNYEYRKLFESNRQLNVRLFAGAFLYNKNPSDFNYFSFALDRPTDYLFDYNYLGRSEDSGLFSQQLIIAEGGFKSKLETPFANQWMTTANVSTTLWKYIQAYGDIGIVKNKSTNAKFVYDSGIRLNLVTDYFEIYFPVYSNLGWEVGQDNYDQKIRFIFTVDPQTLLGLFRRKWY